MEMVRHKFAAPISQSKLFTRTTTVPKSAPLSLIWTWRYVMSHAQQTKPQDFLSYFQMLIARNAKANKLLTDALPTIEAQLRLAATHEPLLAVDLGCGIGQETAELLSRGWQVLAIDFSAEAIAALLGRSQSKEYADRLEARVESFADSSWNNTNLVIAFATLPYGPPDSFDDVWKRITASVLPGGYFVGNLFGSDHIVDATHMVRHSKEQVKSMLSRFEIVKLDEIKRPVDSAEDSEGEPVYYHYFEIIARKQLGR
jgi:tellurite methyltransferase